jgi:hypothetical protein
VLVSSEGAGAPVHRLVREPAAQAEQTPPAQQPDQPAEARQDERWPLVAAGGALLAVLLVVRGVVRRGRYLQR